MTQNSLPQHIQILADAELASLGKFSSRFDVLHRRVAGQKSEVQRVELELKSDPPRKPLIPLQPLRGLLPEQGKGLLSQRSGQVLAGRLTDPTK
jgi:hypothetical protein